jgi:hypothetical protein
LPELPAAVEIGWSVPVARWVGVSVGAVLHVQRVWDDEDHHDELQSDAEILPRSSSGWGDSGASGGTGWFEPPLIRPRPWEGRYVFPMGLHGYGSSPLDAQGRLWAATYGVAAAPVARLVVSADGVEVECPIESPCGAWIVGHVARPDFSNPELLIEAFDTDGELVERFAA